MMLKEINRMFLDKRYQNSLIEYFHYALTHPGMAAFIALNLARARSMLEIFLIELACNQRHTTSLRNVDYGDRIFTQLSLPWFCSTPVNDRYEGAWWRLDYVILVPDSGGARKLGQLSIPVWDFFDEIVVLQSDFVTSTPGSMIFKSGHSAGFADCYQGVQQADTSVIAFSLQRIIPGRLVSQMVSKFNKNTSVHAILPVLEAITSDSTVYSIFDEDLAFDYFKNLLKIDQLPTNEASLQYLDGVRRDLNEVFANHRYPSSDTFQVNNTVISAGQQVTEKWELGNEVQFHIEGVKRCGSTWIVHGWIVDPLSAIGELYLLHSGVSEAIELLRVAVKFDRDDVIAAYGNDHTTTATHYGFASVAYAHNLPLIGGTVEIVITLNCGKSYREQITEKMIELDSNGLQEIVGILTSDEINSYRCERFFRPVFRAFTSGQSKVGQVFNGTFGPNHPYEKPLLTVVIPLYGATRFEMTQIPQLAALRQGDWEIIFAVDDLSILSVVKDNVRRLADLYGLPVHVVAPDRNLGFSGINNFAVKGSRGEYILFLNSDCFLTQPDTVLVGLNWLRQTPSAGAVGFRLLFADGTVQHDGMAVGCWNEQHDFYLNDHPSAGLSAELVPKRPSKDGTVMLTAACLLISRERFDDVDGFHTGYLRGDFEDSDLCLKLVSRGATLGIVRQEGIYHLERQSIGEQAATLRQQITLVNSYIYSQRWKSLLCKTISPLEVIA